MIHVSKKADKDKKKKKKKKKEEEKKKKKKEEEKKKKETVLLCIFVGFLPPNWNFLIDTKYTMTLEELIPY